MNKIGLILIIIAVLLIGVFVGYSFKNRDVNKGNLSFEFSKCDNLEMVSESAGEVMGCYFEIGNKYQDLEVCNQVTKKIGNLKMKNSCILGVAHAKGDPKICSELEGNQTEGCVLGLVIDKKVQDPKICETLSNSPVSYKDDCYKQIGINLNSPTLCAKVSFLTERNTCYFWIAQNTKDSSVCNYIVNDPDVGDSKTNCYNEVARIS